MSERLMPSADSRTSNAEAVTGIEGFLAVKRLMIAPALHDKVSSTHLSLTSTISKFQVEE